MVVRHIQTNLHLRWDHGVLRGTSYYQMLRGVVGEDGVATPFSMGEFEDEYLLVEGRWKIRRRTINRVYAHNGPVSTTSPR